MPAELYRSLPQEYANAFAVLRESEHGTESMLRHDFNGSLGYIGQAWEDFEEELEVEISRFEDLFILDFADLIEITDEDISARIPQLDILDFDQIDEDPRNRSYIETRQAFAPYTAGALMVFRDSIGYFYNEVNGSKEGATKYLEKLRDRQVPLKPLTDYFQAQLEAEEDLTVNGLEYVILYNLLKNAASHTRNDHRLRIDGYFSVVRVDSDTGDFEVTNNLMKGKFVEQDAVLDPLAFVRKSKYDSYSHGYGLFIASVLSHQLGKTFQATKTAQGLFVAEVRTDII